MSIRDIHRIDVELAAAIAEANYIDTEHQKCVIIKDYQVDYEDRPGGQVYDLDMEIIHQDISHLIDYHLESINQL